MTLITKNSGWKPISEASKNKTVLAWCVHDADPYRFGNGKLTTYGAHCEDVERVEDGLCLIEWGGGYFKNNGYELEHLDINISDWWFVYGTDFKVVANPICFIEIDRPLGAMINYCRRLLKNENF